jgi:hypothetical protein
VEGGKDQDTVLLKKGKGSPLTLCLLEGKLQGSLHTGCCWIQVCVVCGLAQVYLREAPWPSAQSEIRTISAYKTPRDKVQCVLRMCSTIMNLLSLATEDSVPGADDFVPVLVFVLIKVGLTLSVKDFMCHPEQGSVSHHEC